MKAFFSFLGIFLLYSCSQPTTPKARGYFRIDFPEKSYKLVEEKGLYSFKLPIYAVLKSDDANKNSWQNVYFPKQNGQLHLTYFSLKGNLAEYLEDTHKFVYKHTIKADDIKEREFAYPQHRVFGSLYDIEGNTASSVQFFLTDSTTHFLRGALYLNERPNKDSLDIVVKFLREDVLVLMETLEWK
ncbi:MAG: gliding motility lipoprotein GldD [Flavobacteriaceae bacterium]|nr:gliding motility lipoprotein GldD [Flavobacteriaceae bacterium]